MSRPYISGELRQQVIEDAGSVCGYCLSEEVLMGVSLSFEHLIPVAAGGETNRDNLWRACRQCNELKSASVTGHDSTTGTTVALFNPRFQDWEEHFRWRDDYTSIEGITPTGRVTVSLLQLNRSLLCKARKRWRMMGWLPQYGSD